MRFITSCFNVILENNEVGAENVKLRMGSEQNLLKIKYNSKNFVKISSCLITSSNKNQQSNETVSCVHAYVINIFIQMFTILSELKRFVYSMNSVKSLLIVGRALDSM